jgi:hypothetical protein
MPYFILVLGLIIIYFALRKDRKSANNNLFSHVLKDKTTKVELSDVMDRVVELEFRIEEIEKSLLVLNEDLNVNNVKQSRQLEDMDIEIDENKYITNEDTIDIDIETNEFEFAPEASVIQKDVNDRIFELSDSGKSVDDIASILKMGKGEILLRLGLRKQKK